MINRASTIPSPLATGANPFATNPSYKTISNLLAKQLSDRTPHHELTKVLVKAIDLKQAASTTDATRLDVATKLKSAILDNDKINPEFKGLKDKLLTILIGTQKKLQAEPSLHLAIESHKAFQTFDKHQSWRLMVDHSQLQEKGEYGFEVESGYLGGMFGAFHHMLETIDHPLDASLLEALHDKAVEGVLPAGKTMQEQLVQEQYGLPEITLKLGFRDDQQSKSINLILSEFNQSVSANASEAGVIELIKNQQHQLEPWFDVSGAILKEGKLTYQDLNAIKLNTQPKVKEQCTDLAQDILAESSQEVGLAVTESDKLSVSARCCQQLARAQLFSDGNTRTVGIIVLNKLLLQQMLTPVIMPNLNCFMAFSAKELINEIKLGQSLFENYTVGRVDAQPKKIPAYAKFV